MCRKTLRNSSRILKQSEKFFVYSLYRIAIRLLLRRRAICKDFSSDFCWLWLMYTPEVQSTGSVQYAVRLASFLAISYKRVCQVSAGQRSVTYISSACDNVVREKKSMQYFICRCARSVTMCCTFITCTK